MRFAWALLFIGFLPLPVWAKPISYVGGTMAMQENDDTGQTLALDYTVTPDYALGLYAKHETGGREFWVAGPQVNVLLKRWNLPDGQGNIFNSTGFGAAQDAKAGTRPAMWTGFLADYETRRIFTSYEVRLMYADAIEAAHWHRARVGVAPYLANYDELSTWLMLQADYHPQKDHEVTVTPLVRVFYKTTLAELGVSTRGDLMFNWALQF